MASYLRSSILYPKADLAEKLKRYPIKHSMA